MKKRIIFFLSILLLTPLFALSQQTSPADATTADLTQVTTEPPATTPALPAPTNTPTTQPASTQFVGQREGVFDCNPNGAFAQSIGALSATGGVYVPVADATVELNTGILVYKECTLREIVDRMRESATSAFTKQLVNAIKTGREGNAQYMVNPRQEYLDVRDKEYLQGIQAAQQSFNPALRSSVTTGIARNYLASTRAPNSILTCGYQNNLTAFTKSQRGSFSFEGLAAVGNPACYSMGLFNISQDLIGGQAATAVQYLQDQISYGRGFYPRYSTGQDPLRQQILTPASVVQEGFQQVLGSGFRQLENANDVGQMVGALFAGIGNQVIGSNGGLAGLTQSTAGQPSYLDQVASESAAGLRNAAVNAALQILVSAQQVETSYLKAVNAIGTNLVQTIMQLRSAENQCWALIVPKVQDYATQNNINLQVATSTAFSQSVISAQIIPLATTTAANIDTSFKAVQLLNNLIAGITNTTSLDAQRVALQQLDTLVAQKQLHTPQDLSAIQKNQVDIQAAMTNLVQTTIQAWGDNADPTVGWCNVNNPAVIQMWAQKWTK